MAIEIAEWVQAASLLGAGIAMGFGAIGAGVGEGHAAERASGAMARQPAVADRIVRAMLLGQAITETAGIFALVIAILLIFTAPGRPLSAHVYAMIGAGISIGFAGVSAGVGGGFPSAQACEGIARNPGLSGPIMRTMLLGQAICQSPAIFSLVISLVLIFLDLSGKGFTLSVALLSAGISMGFGSIGPGIGSGWAAAGAVSAIGRFPETGGSITRTMVLGLAVSQTTAVYALVVAMLLIFVI
jgi:F0F1-type ATP synthase membrane subunit c/vacuolar-type H+-ATPase subunit K